MKRPHGGRITDEEVDEIRTILLRALDRDDEKQRSMVKSCTPSNDTAASSATSASAA